MHCSIVSCCFLIARGKQFRLTGHGGLFLGISAKLTTVLLYPLLKDELFTSAICLISLHPLLSWVFALLKLVAMLKWFSTRR